MKRLVLLSQTPDIPSTAKLSPEQLEGLRRRSCEDIAAHSRPGTFALPMGLLLIGAAADLTRLPAFQIAFVICLVFTVFRFRWLGRFARHYDPSPDTWLARFGAQLAAAGLMFSGCGAWIIQDRGVDEAGLLGVAIALAVLSQATVIYAHSYRLLIVYWAFIFAPFLVACAFAPGIGPLVAFGGAAFTVYCARTSRNLHRRHWQGMVDEILLTERAEELRSARDALSEIKGQLEHRVQEQVTEVRQIAEELRKREADYRLIFDSAHDAILIFDPDGERILNANRRAEELYGYGKDQLIGMSLLEISVDSERGAEKLDTVIDSGNWVRFETRQKRSDGTVMDLEVRALAIEHQGREAVLSLNRDITEIRRAEGLRLEKEAAERASEAKGQLLANMSHEMRTPMVSIIGLSELLLQGDRLVSTDRRQLEIIRGSGEMLLAIIDDILDFSRADVGKVELEPRPFELDQVVSGVIDMVGLRARSSGVELRVAVDPGLPDAFLGDASRLRQILLNLLGNAVKFTEQGVVSLEVLPSRSGDASIGGGVSEGPSRRLRFQVTDSGPGIDPELQVDLFEPFTQADTTTSRRFGGSGLGLAICKRLAELMGGSVGFHSVLGQGSVFWLDIELPTAQIDAPSALGTGVDLSSIHGLEILVTEDNPVNQLVLAEQLQELGLQVVTAEDGVEAVERLRERFFPIVLMDCQMPRMDGYEATRRIRRLERERVAGKSSYIIATTAHAMAEARERCLAVGMDGFLAKPFTLEQLAETLATYSRTR